jgi:hypothetical protein
MKDCNPKARKATLPHHICNGNTGRWNKEKPKQVVMNQTQEIAELKRALKLSKEAYDELAKKNATNILRFAITRMFLRKCRSKQSSPSTKSQSTQTSFSPALSVVSPAATTPIANVVTPAVVNEIRKTSTKSPTLVEILNDAILTPSFNVKKTKRSPDTSPRLADLLHGAMKSPSYKKRAIEKRLDFQSPVPKTPKKGAIVLKPRSTQAVLKQSDLLTASAFADTSYRLDKELFNDRMSDISTSSEYSLFLDDSPLDKRATSVSVAPTARKTATSQELLEFLKDLSEDNIIVDSDSDTDKFNAGIDFATQDVIMGLMDGL